METVLRDPGLLALQREGGTTLASLQQEASGLNANPDVRYKHPVSPPSFPVRVQKRGPPCEENAYCESREATSLPSEPWG